MIETGLALARWLQFASAVLLCGVPAFCFYGMSSAAFAAKRAWIKRVLLWAVAVALIGALFMLFAESAEMSGDIASAADAGTILSVASGTFFGAVWFVRLALLAILAIFIIGFDGSGDDRFVLAVFGSLFAASLAWQGHGGEGAGALGAIHRVADIVHILAASVWIGALMVLVHLLARNAPGDAALYGLTRFSGVGPFAVASLVVTGLVNVWALAAPRPIVEAVSTPYAMVLGAKIALFTGMLGLAAVNRFAHTRNLAAALEEPSKTERAVAAVRQSVLIETVLAIFVLIAVAVLGVLEPPNAV
jgi:putative copper resistance protein D